MGQLHARLQHHTRHFSRTGLMNIAALLLFAIVGTVLVFATHATTPAASIEAEAATPIQTISDSTASASKAVKFSKAVATSCVGAIYTPGGSDGLGGCFPGAYNTGYPHGLAGDTRTPVSLSNYTGSCTITGSVTLNAQKFNCDLEIRAPASAVIIIKNSQINGRVMHDPGDTPSAWPSLTFQDTEINGDAGGNYSAIMFGNYTLDRVNINGGNHNVYCAYNCTVTDTWIHTPVSVPESHNNGVFMWGDGLILTHSTIACDIPTVANGGCSADVFVKGGSTNVNIQKNLFVATTNGGFYYCTYGGQYDPTYDPTREHDIVYKDNIFQRGPTNKCGGVSGDPTAWAETAFDPTSPGNLWQNNRWDDGSQVSLQ